MSQARLREALSAGGPATGAKDKGPPVADGVLSVTPDTPEAQEWKNRQSPIDIVCASSPYLDEPDDGAGPSSPGDLYGKFTWRIEKFSEISKRELRSTVFEVGNYKWYILVYPQGCDVCNHLSLFLCVADYDKLLPGWSHFAQFTIAVVNKDPKKSKYSDTLHRFCKKEHDWGWKKFMELSKILEGFTVQDTLVIKAQVQVIRDRPGRPFRCLDAQYRRELVRVYLTNVEGICRRFLDERREKLGRLAGGEKSSFGKYWEGLSEQQQQALVTERADVLLKGLVKQFFNEKEVTSTLVMDALLCGCKQLEAASRGIDCTPASTLTGEGSGATGTLSPSGGGGGGGAGPMVVIDAERSTFAINGNLVSVLQRAVADVLPPSGRDDKEPLAARSGHEGDEYSKTSVDRDECRLADLGRRAVECYALAHIVGTRVEAAFVEAECVKMQDALIREEEELEREEEKRAKERAEADKEKKLRKKARQKAKKEAERMKKEQEEAEKARVEAAKREEAERRAREAADRRRAASEEETSKPHSIPSSGVPSAVLPSNSTQNNQPHPSTKGGLGGPTAPPKTHRHTKSTDTTSDMSPQAGASSYDTGPLLSSSHRRLESETSGLPTSSEEDDGASTSTDGELEALQEHAAVLRARLADAQTTVATRDAQLREKDGVIERQRVLLQRAEEVAEKQATQLAQLRARVAVLEADLEAAVARGTTGNGTTDTSSGGGSGVDGASGGGGASRPHSRGDHGQQHEKPGSRAGGEEEEGGRYRAGRVGNGGSVGGGGGYRGSGRGGGKDMGGRPIVAQAQVPAIARVDTSTHKGAIPPHRGSLDNTSKQGPAQPPAPPPPQPPQASGAYMGQQDTVLSYRNAAVAAAAPGGQGSMGGGNPPPPMGARPGPVQPPPPPPPVANGKHAYVGAGGGQYGPPGYGAPAHAATTPTTTKIRPEGLLESPGLDDFAHLGLITDLLE